MFYFVCLVCFTLLVLCNTNTQFKHGDVYLVHYTGTKENMINSLAAYGYTFKRQVIPEFYHFIRTRTIANYMMNNRDMVETLKRKDRSLKLLYKEKPLMREKRSVQKATIVIDDLEWSKQWHLHASTVPSMHVKDIWEKGWTGAGVIIAIVDDGIDTTHVDLISNYNATVSYDYVQDDDDPSHARSDESHGTNCAGVAAASKNDQCVIGTAYGSSLAAIRLLEIGFHAVASQEASALVHRLDVIDIYSNSWGPPDDGKGFDESDMLQEVQRAALVEGTTKGRNGKGAIYIWASGNGGTRNDDCNVDGYSSSMYTISVAGLAPDSSPASYSEECTAILTATYGGEITSQSIPTTESGNGCVDTFHGTSAACPMASGIIALALESNRLLTWRDVQHLIVETSISTSDVKGNFYANAAGKNVSLTHGFGLMNAASLVSSAETWSTVPKQLRCESATKHPYRSVTGIVQLSDTNKLNGCFINHLEHVHIHITFKFQYREGSSIYITSPQGTKSRILRKRTHDVRASTVDWTFMSVHSWGEHASGTWTLQLVSSEQQNNMTLYSWRVEVYGTVTNPSNGTPDDGKTGGHCNETHACTDAGTGCLEDFNVCVLCNGDFRVIDGWCVEDGTLSGYCDEYIVCKDTSHGCNATSNVCVICNDDHRVIDGFCIKDGTEGGYCDDNIHCVETDIGCQASTELCILCTNGYSVINNYCIQDGSLGGHCINSSNPCNNSDTGCSENNICIECLRNYHIIEGFCIKDGSNGGYCDSGILCNTELGCNVTINRCQHCDNGSRPIGGYCVEDGTVGGYCDNKVTYCVTNTTCEGNICRLNNPDMRVHDDQDDTVLIAVTCSISGVVVGILAGCIVKHVESKRKRVASATSHHADVHQPNSDTVTVK